MYIWSTFPPSKNMEIENIDLYKSRYVKEMCLFSLLVCVCLACQGDVFVSTRHRISLKLGQRKTCMKLLGMVTMPV